MDVKSKHGGRRTMPALVTYADRTVPDLVTDAGRAVPDLIYCTLRMSEPL